MSDDSAYNDLKIKLCLAPELFSREQLGALHEVVKEVLPSWSSRLQVALDEDAPRRPVPAGASLHEAVIREVPARQARHGMGRAELYGGLKEIVFYLSTSTKSFLPYGNNIGVEVIDQEEVEGQPLGRWSLRFLREAAARMPVRYARGCLKGEFFAKNMVDDETGSRAIGVSLHDALPGLYFMNYFGPPCVELIGMERLLSAPAPIVEKIGDGVLIALAENPREWSTEPYRSRERQVMEHLGREYFFLRDEPDRQTFGPRW